jgi:hypothetical protein
MDNADPQQPFMPMRPVSERRGSDGRADEKHWELSRFLEAVSFSMPQCLGAMCPRECEIERKVVEGYIGILEDLLLAYREMVFTKRAKRATASHSKFYLFDAVYMTLRPSGPLTVRRTTAGH